MRKKSKKSYSAKLKFQVVLEALTSDKGDAEIARAYDVHPVSLSKMLFLYIIPIKANPLLLYQQGVSSVKYSLCISQKMIGSSP